MNIVEKVVIAGQMQTWRGPIGMLSPLQLPPSREKEAAISVDDDFGKVPLWIDRRRRVRITRRDASSDPRSAASRNGERAIIIDDESPPAGLRLYEEFR